MYISSFFKIYSICRITFLSHFIYSLEHKKKSEKNNKIKIKINMNINVEKISDTKLNMRIN